MNAIVVRTSNSVAAIAPLLTIKILLHQLPDPLMELVNYDVHEAQKQYLLE
ncbi:MAG: hypothetical protein ACR2LR_09155 [Hassallia sp.]